MIENILALTVLKLFHTQSKQIIYYLHYVCYVVMLCCKVTKLCRLAKTRLEISMMTAREKEQSIESKALETILKV